MKLSELIEHVGDDNIGFQNLDHDTAEAEMSGGVGRITFRTDPQHVKERAFGEASHVALVLWIPKDKLPEDMEEAS